MPMMAQMSTSLSRKQMFPYFVVAVVVAVVDVAVNVVVLLIRRMPLDYLILGIFVRK